MMRRLMILLFCGLAACSAVNPHDDASSETAGNREPHQEQDQAKVSDPGPIWGDSETGTWVGNAECDCFVRID